MSDQEDLPSIRKKIVELDDLPAIVARTKAEGKSVVLAHGVFDLLHLGHVRHLEAARREGSVLVVTLTADRFVNKGPGRPVFSEQLRAEMIAALEYVSWVAVNRQSSAEDMLRSIAPDVYVKGAEYANAEDDVTGKIVNEREAVESVGGRIVFTEDITFSSSALINRHLNVYDPPLQRYLEEMRDQGALGRIREAVESIREMRVLFVGDAIIDQYDYVVPLAKSPKENMIATQFQDREIFAGGVFAAANHLASFCAKVDVISCLGGDESHEALVRDQLNPAIDLTVVWRPGAPTTRKTRFLDSYSMRKLFEIYNMDDSPLPISAAEEFRALLNERVGDYDLVIVTDFGHGLIDAESKSILSQKAKFLAVNAQTNSSNLGFNLITKYRQADFICIDHNEARLAAQDKFSDVMELVGCHLPARIECPNMIVTQGKHGCVAFQRDGGVWRVPALTSMIVDTVGAGDAFFSITAPLVRAGVPMNLVGFIGNAAGAVKVGILGHRTAVEKASLLKFATALLK